jgi:hypothetical protein
VLSFQQQKLIGQVEEIAQDGRAAALVAEMHHAGHLRKHSWIGVVPKTDNGEAMGEKRPLHDSKGWGHEQFQAK